MRTAILLAIPEQRGSHMAKIVEKVLLALLAGATAGAVLLFGLRLMPVAHAEGDGNTVVEVVKAHRMEIVDGTNKTRIVMNVDDQGVAAVSLLDETGALRSGLSVAKGGKTIVSSEHATAKPTPRPDVEIDPDLSLENPGFDNDAIGRCLIGTVKNTTEQPFKSVEIKFAIYNDSGTPIGDVSAHSGNLATGRTWKFRIPLGFLNGASYKLKILRERQ